MHGPSQGHLGGGGVKVHFSLQLIRKFVARLFCALASVEVSGRGVDAGTGRDGQTRGETGASPGWATYLWCSEALGEAAEAAEEEGEGTFDSGTPAGTVR